ncbi:MAG: LLM class flavin-dependent oxidoreductase [Chloroflexi bacterium]|nr:LLM class flavin-dependent oxidoreductase [Chloroflexota bacterium]
MLALTGRASKTYPPGLPPLDRLVRRAPAGGAGRGVAEAQDLARGAAVGKERTFPMKFALWIPSYAWPDLTHTQARRAVKEFARKADGLGLDLWVIDHLLHAPGLYGVSWLEPMTVLSVAAGCTERVKLGTGILVLPLRNPVLLAKEIATLDALSEGRFVFGVGPGWYPGEYTAVGNRIEERGQRTDEVLAAVRRLLTEERVTFRGQYYQFEDVTIEPRPPAMPEVWVSGGARIPDPEYHDKSAIARSVLKRIAGADGWLSRCSGKQEWVKNDWEVITDFVRANGRDPATLRFGHTNFIHLVDTNDRELALREQRRAFEQTMGTHRSFEHLQECYMMGSIDDLVARIDDLRQAGMEYLVLGPVSDDLEQIDILAERIIPRFQS